VDHVPDLLRGCWKRRWIRFADGTVDDTSLVVWLQLPSLMADVRLAADQPDLMRRGGLAACSLDDLRRLAASESSSGFTTCTPITTGDDGVRRATAEWFTRGHGVAFQPVSAYPEPGVLEWNDDGTVMVERAPSGAYTEEWHLLPGSRDPLVHQVLADGRQWYRAGTTGVLVRDRLRPVPRAARLDELVAELGDDRQAIAELVDCEFSVAERRGQDWTITASTLPWRSGEVIDGDLG
jgi:hypothetical protein